jgi:predicted acylesterase/phospholipase RssA
VSGVSVGAVNAAAMAIFEKGKEIEMADYLMGIWENLTNDSIWKWRDTWNPLEPVFEESGYLDTTPL